jgi:hypothetical protein
MNPSTTSNIGKASEKSEKELLSNTSWQTLYSDVTGGRDDVSS